MIGWARNQVNQKGNEMKWIYSRTSFTQKDWFKTKYISTFPPYMTYLIKQCVSANQFNPQAYSISSCVLSPSQTPSVYKPSFCINF